MRIVRGLSIIFIACVAACSGPVDDGGADTQDIIGGKLAKKYEEAVVIDMIDGGRAVAGCSGALIAPRVVLTAGHCVNGWSRWRVLAPFAAAGTADATDGATYDYASDSEAVDPSRHDVGLIFLSSAITLSSYPAIASGPVDAGTKVVHVGRIQNGVLHDDALFASKATAIAPADALGFPNDYYAGDLIESGDSGGPDFLSGNGAHTIVSVNSGSNSQTEVLARVDPVAAWIAKQIAAHAGGGTTKKPKPKGCAHDVCVDGAKLDASCGGCAADVCSSDDYCCATAWDAQCAGEAASWCGTCD